MSRRIRNKYTGEVREVPDDSPLGRVTGPDTERGASVDRAAAGAVPVNEPESMKASAPFRMLRGAGRLVMETGGQAPARLLGKLGVPGMTEAAARFDEHKRANPLGDAGELGGAAADFGMMMGPTPFGKGKLPLKIAGEVGKGVGTHQAQTYAKTGEMDGGAAAIEGGATALFTGAPAFLKGAGVSTLRRALGIPRKFNRGANRIDLNDALEQRKIPFIGGAERIADEAGKRIGASDDKLVELLKKEYVETPYADVANAANRRLFNMEKAGEVDVGTFDLAKAARDQADQNAMNLGKQAGAFKPLMVKGPEWRTLRKRADDAAQYDKTTNKIPPPGARYSQIYRDETEKMLSREMRATESAPEYARVRREMRKDVPLKQAAQDKLERSTGLMDLATGGAFALPGASQLAYGNIGTAAILGTMGLGGHALWKTPGGARLLYEMGRGPRSVGGQKAQKAALALARSQAFMPEDE